MLFITCLKIAIFPYLLHLNAGKVTPALKCGVHLIGVCILEQGV